MPIRIGADPDWNRCLPLLWHAAIPNNVAAGHSAGNSDSKFMGFAAMKDRSC